MESGNGLYLYFGGGISMMDVILLLSDSNKTSRIQYTYGKVELVFEGYTKPVMINDEGTAITAMLVKDGANDGEHN
jgi:hypothetical protein